MHLKFRNINDAFYHLVNKLHTGTIPTYVRSSRYGEIAYVEEPIVITYSNPRERVLFNSARDCNPFFHLYEAIWMLAGRNDLAPLAYYNSRMTEFSDDGETFNGAYGYRWRHAGPVPVGRKHEQYVDQLDEIVKHLSRNPHSRRAVLQMWNVADDLLQVESSKDVACNLSACFSVVLGKCPSCKGTGYELSRDVPTRTSVSGGAHGAFCPRCGGKSSEVPSKLDMTVFNRSNDIVWGLLGTNVVHFSFLQEYLAGRLGLEVGVYNQVTNNLHYYTKNWKPEKWLREYEQHTGRNYQWYYYNEGWDIPLYDGHFDEELPAFVERHGRYVGITAYRSQFLREVAGPLLRAFHRYRLREYRGAWDSLLDVKASDWRTAAEIWLRKREANVS